MVRDRVRVRIRIRVRVKDWVKEMKNQTPKQQ
jgi:hypothetical protein